MDFFRACLMLAVVVCVGSQTSQSDIAENNCTDDYTELKESILMNRVDINNLLLGFYPPNESPSRILDVNYYVENISIFQDQNSSDIYTFQWVDSSTLLLTEVKLFQALSFGIASLQIRSVNITIPPFCVKEEAVDLLNQVTIYLKIYASGFPRETERYYAQFFNGEKYVVIGNSNIRTTTLSLLVFEYIGSIGFPVVICVLLLINVSYIGWIMSEISVPCTIFLVAILVTDIENYNDRSSVRFSNEEWSRALPIPVMFPFLAALNLLLSIVVVMIVQRYDQKQIKKVIPVDLNQSAATYSKSNERDEEVGLFLLLQNQPGENIQRMQEIFPLPALIQVYLSQNEKLSTRLINSGREKKIVHKIVNVFEVILKIFLLFSVTSFLSVFSFHYIWVALAVSAYPVRSMATLSFVLPFLLISATTYAVIEIVAFQMQQNVDERSYQCLKWMNMKIQVNMETDATQSSNKKELNDDAKKTLAVTQSDSDNDDAKKTLAVTQLDIDTTGITVNSGAQPDRSHDRGKSSKNKTKIFSSVKNLCNSSKTKFALSLILIVIPILFIANGFLYFYSQALVDVNDSENDPAKTFIGASIPSVIAGLFIYSSKVIVGRFVKRKEDKSK